MQTKTIPIGSVKPNPDNPRIIKDEKFRKLVQSIKDFPEMLALRPIVVNSEMVVLGGNMRLKACEAAGLTDVPVTIASGLTEEQQREFIIKDNVGFGEWDWDALANEDPTARERLTVPILPFSRIAEMGAGMYRGKARARSTDSGAPSDQLGGGGADPTRALSSEGAVSDG